MHKYSLWAKEARKFLYDGTYSLRKNYSSSVKDSSGKYLGSLPGLIILAKYKLMHGNIDNCIELIRELDPFSATFMETLEKQSNWLGDEKGLTYLLAQLGLDNINSSIKDFLLSPYLGRVMYDSFERFFSKDFNQRTELILDSMVTNGSRYYEAFHP